MNEVTERLRAIERERPDVIRLAEAVSLAVLVDPPLLRRARLTLVPDADTGTEADLWLGPLVRSRSPAGIVFPPEVAQALRERLKRDRKRLFRAREITRDLHGHFSPAVRLEEEIAWLSVSPDPDAVLQIEALLRSVLAAMVDGERPGLARWAARALPMLPSAIRVLPTVQMLAAGAHFRLGGDAGLIRSREGIPDWASWVAPANLPRVPVRVVLRAGAVELDSASVAGGNTLELPRTEPLLVDLSWDDPAAGQGGVQVTFRQGEVKSVRVPVSDIRLRTVLGEVYHLRPKRRIRLPPRASGIFISYRRIDTMAWAGHLVADLRKSFGASQIFMDIDGGTPRGADFEQVLTTSLEGCDALLALIGPRWIDCTRSDGTRRLDAPDDWVRNEISTALRRNIPVIPVLLGGASFPGEAELPEDLRALRKRQRAKITDTRWDYDIGELIKDLVKLTSLRPLDDVVTANTGIRLLNDLIAKVPAVADAVSLSKEAIENFYSQVGKLVLFKVIHDSLHTIEIECLRPIQAGGPTGRLRPFKIRFAGEARRIQEAIQEKEWNAVLRDDLVDRLDSATAALETAMEAPNEAAYGRVVGELNGLLSGLFPQLDVGIAEAAAGLNLDRLLELMTSVKDTLTATAAGKDPELEPFVQGIDALSRLRDELNKRVSEHGILQRLDSKLRTVCVGGTLPGILAGEWVRIRRVRSRLAPPFSPELGAVNDDLVAIEGEIEASLGQGNEAAALDLVSEYFRAVSSVFRDVDGSLKEVCLRLSTVAWPLKTVLSMPLGREA